MDSFDYVVPLEWEGEPWKTPVKAWAGKVPGTTIRLTPETEVDVIEGLDGVAAAVPIEAVRLTHKLWTNAIEDVQMEVALDRVNGGIGGTLDIQIGITNALTAIRGCARQLAEKEVEAVPAVKLAAPAKPAAPDAHRPLDQAKKPAAPDVDGEKLLKDRAEEIVRAVEALEEQPEVSDEPRRTLWRSLHVLTRLEQLRERQQLVAAWPTTVIRPPPGWEDFGALRVGGHIKLGVQSAHARARQAALVASGK